MSNNRLDRALMFSLLTGRNTALYIRFGAMRPVVEESHMATDQAMFEPDQAPPPDAMEDALNLDNWTEVATVPAEPIPAAMPDVGAEFMRRLFEPLPYEHRVMFRPGDVVKHSRPDLWGNVPLNAEGVVVSLEHPESVMASKGRDYLVEFDLTPFKIPVDPAIIAMLQRAGVAAEQIPEFMGKVTQNMSYNDLTIHRKGAGWADPNYVYPFEHDQTTYAIWCKGMADNIYNRISAEVDKELAALKAANSNGSN